MQLQVASHLVRMDLVIHLSRSTFEIEFELILLVETMKATIELLKLVLTKIFSHIGK